MKVNELQARQGKVDIELDIIDVGEPREFEKFGKTGKVATAIGKDETGDIKISLWNEQVEQVIEIGIHGLYRAGNVFHVIDNFIQGIQGFVPVSETVDDIIDPVNDPVNDRKGHLPPGGKRIV